MFAITVALRAHFREPPKASSRCLFWEALEQEDVLLLVLSWSCDAAKHDGDSKGDNRRVRGKEEDREGGREEQEDF